MQQYSKEFEAGQVGMVLVNANVSGDFNDADQANDDPVEILQKIDNLEASLNTVENTTTVSVVFLMKSSGVQVTRCPVKVSTICSNSFLALGINNVRTSKRRPTYYSTKANPSTPRFGIC